MFAGTVAWAQQRVSHAQFPAVTADVAVTYAPEHAQMVPGKCCFWLEGGGVDAAVSFWKGFGIAASLTGQHASNYVPGMDLSKIDALMGPRYTYTVWASHPGVTPRPRLQIFGEGLFGGSHGFHGAFPAPGGLVASASSFALQTGGGVNIFFSRNFGVRLLEADYVRTELPNNTDNVQNDLRLGFGLTYHTGTVPPAPVTLACSSSPAAVYPGDPVAVTAIAGGLAPKLNALYGWAGTGITSNGPTATVATASLAPGTYAVKATVKEGKAGKEGLKPGETAECSTSFKVKAFEPPTVSCSASPSTIAPGQTAVVTALGVSPQNRPLTYSYAASAGTVSGSGTTAAFSSTGAPTGVVGISCSVSDDKGQTATANTNITITAPYVAPAPRTQALCSISFAKDTKRPARVNNEAKACLDEVALELQRQPDAKAVLVGQATAAERTPRKGHNHATVADLAAQRAVNTKEYLVEEKGLDAARISVVAGVADEQTVEDYLVPVGASFAADVPGTTPVDESTVKPQKRK